MYGAANGYPIGDRSTFYDIPVLVGSHSHLDEVFEARLIHKAPTPSRLVRVAEPGIAWKFQGLDLTLDDYLARDNTIFVERYQYGRTSLRHLLQMTSGIRFSENYSGNDDVIRLVFDTYLLQGASGVGAATSFNERERPAGTKFSYASVETQVLGLVLRAVTGHPVAAYPEEKIWQPIGAEADAVGIQPLSEGAFHWLDWYRVLPRSAESLALSGHPSRGPVAAPIPQQDSHAQSSSGQLLVPIVGRTEKGDMSNLVGAGEHVPPLGVPPEVGVRAWSALM